MNGSPSPSTTACSPAPGRALLVMKDNAQPDPGAMFLSFDSILSSVSTMSPTSPGRAGSSNFSGDRKQGSTGTNSSNTPLSPDTKRRWGILRSLMPFSSTAASKSKFPSRNASSSATSLGAQQDVSLEQKTDDRVDFASTPRKPKDQGSGSPVKSQAFPSYQSFSFKFSLEWYDRGSPPSNEQTLHPPRMPPPSSHFIVSGKEATLDDLEPRRPPEGSSASSSQYAGRALAEWNLLIDECQSFFERRRREGVPTDEKVETPLLDITSLNGSRR